VGITGNPFFMIALRSGVFESLVGGTQLDAEHIEEIRRGHSSFSCVLQFDSLTQGQN
jgi:hypothetical protein